MNILDKIVEHKHKEIAKRKIQYPIELLEQSIYFDSETFSLKEYIIREDKSGIIAEFKRKSPSKGLINELADVEQVTTGYVQAGVSALSVLTDSKFFGGSYNDLAEARKHNNCPILRKDFIIDEYQIIGAKSIGADAILLIAAILDKAQVKRLSEFAHSLQLEVLLEVHNKKELNVLNKNIDLVGVNNRNLKDFSMDTATTFRLKKMIPDGIVIVGESGLKTAADIQALHTAGVHAALIGETLMRGSNGGNTLHGLRKAENKQ